jgi:transcription-repair coupling factor (superfamily II helicase)
MIKLKKGTSYLKSGNIFSRVFLIGKNLDSKNMIIFDKDEDLKSFSKIWKYFGFPGFTEVNDNGWILRFINSIDWIYFTTKDIFESKEITIYDLDKNTIDLVRWKTFDFENLLKNLTDFSYKHSAHLGAEWSFNREWDTINIRLDDSGNTYKISFFWDEIDEILKLVNNDVHSVEKLDRIKISNNSFVSSNKEKLLIDNLDLFLKSNDYHTYLIWVDFWMHKEELSKKLKPTVFSDLPAHNAVDINIESFSVSSIQELLDTLKDVNRNIKIYTKNSRTIHNFIDYNDLSKKIEVTEVPPGLRNLESFTSKNPILWSAEDKLQELVICDDVLSDIFVKKRSRKSLAKSFDLLLEIRPWNYIVHVDHWIWIFNQIIIKELSWIKREYIEIQYRENDKLFVPISELHRVSKYIWDDKPTLSRLNSTEWQKIIKSTEIEVEKIARELLDIYANRSIVTGYPFYPLKKEEEDFKAAFPFKYTIDQENSINEILKDMEFPKPMDRLLVWDVGFGKTEVAMNAIYRCILNKKQAAFISPLVILAYEHFESLKKRFEQFGVIIEVMTRVTTAKEEKNILDRLASWKVDCIIWTHRLLSEDVRFKDLWLVVIDEEHRFWVLDKERLNKIRSHIDILSLSATPIPRSLNFALNGIKDISIIATPPPKKQPIRTLVSKWSDEIIREAIKFEFERWWQVLFIHNRIATIDSTRHYLEKLIWKSAKITITHGQMNWLEVEDRIISFKNWKYNILLSTTVIENWVNFFNANTIIIDDADTFWLSQLHQLRWRVWRWWTEWFCHLIYRKELLADDAKKRLVTIVNNTHLWAWFEIAMRDLEIRWAGDILWIKQSWKSKETWISLYLRLLENKIEELKTGKKHETINCQIELWVSYYIPEDFFSSEADKIHFFRNIESIETLEDLDFAHKTFIEWNDSIPEEFENLFLILKIRIILSHYWVRSLKKTWQSYIFEIDKETRWEKIREFLDKFDVNKDFVLITIHKIKVETKFFKNDQWFLKFLDK